MISLKLDILTPKEKVPVGEPKPRSRPWKYLLPIEIASELIISNNKRNTEIDESKKFEILILNVAMSITEVSSKIYKLRSYDEIVNDHIYDWY